MKKITFAIILLLFTISLQAEIPIVAYYGIPLEESNVNRFKDFRGRYPLWLIMVFL